MTRKWICLLLYCIPMMVVGQEYAMQHIPDALLKNAHAIKRKEQYTLTIETPAKYTLRKLQVFTILDAAGSYLAAYQCGYDRFSSIVHIAGKMYDRSGKEIRHTKKGDWKDYSAFDGISLASDARLKHYEFYNTEYPFTVEFEEEIAFSGTQGFPRWMPLDAPNLSVQHSAYVIIAPAHYNVRYKAVNCAAVPVIQQKGSANMYTWQMDGLTAINAELSAPPLSELVPNVIFAPAAFEVQGFVGDMSSWEQYGKFMCQLLKGRDVLPAAIRQQVHALTDTVSDTTAKINVLYQYLQQNTRYISIQLGIGGWQPFDATYVAEKKYGDCKALSNFMIALLKEAGITGKYVEIYSGSNVPKFHEDFSFSQADHVICCVPLAKDTVWLECTNQTAAAGYIGSFTGNRKAILIDEAGAKIVHTPVYAASNNIRMRRISATLDTEGNLLADISNRYTGLRQELPHELLHEASTVKREKYFNSIFRIPTYKVLQHHYREKKAAIPEMYENLQISCSNFATITGKRLFVSTGLFESAEQLAPDSARMFDYIVKDGYRDIDSIEITVPPGYQVESLPKPILLDTKFGQYEISIVMQGNVIRCYRKLEQAAMRVPAAEFNQLVAFYGQVYKSDTSRVVLVKAQ